eukprot:13160.XXX_285527_285658_1 [CDS] Oithona nana genome sequencing.
MIHLTHSSFLLLFLGLKAVVLLQLHHLSPFHRQGQPLLGLGPL